MLSTTDAIVLSLQPHSDKAHILHAYTRAGGRVNYMVYGLGKKNAIGLYMPLSLIRITANHDSLKPPTVKEATLLLSNNISGLTSDIYKQTVCLFIAEVLYHVMRHPMEDEPMFDYLQQSIETLAKSDEPQNFHLQFMVGLAAKLGFAMDKELPIPHTRKERQETLQALCRYFEEHVETWQNPRSLEVLMEVFD